MIFKKDIKYIYFDLDNTLWDFKRNTLIALEKLYNEKALGFKKRGINFYKFRDTYRCHNEEAWRSYERGQLTAQEVKLKRFENTLEELKLTNILNGKDMNNTYLNYLLELPHLMNHGKEILDYLHPVYPLGILSNGFRNGQYSKMTSSGILHYFKDIITSDLIGTAKPNPAIFHHAIEMSGYKAHEIAYIGDDYLVDTIAANNIGMKGILLDPLDRIHDPNINKIKDLLELTNYF